MRELDLNPGNLTALILFVLYCGCPEWCSEFTPGSLLKDYYWWQLKGATGGVENQTFVACKQALYPNFSVYTGQARDYFSGTQGDAQSFVVFLWWPSCRWWHLSQLR